jgi:UDP-N-acetyl-D-mannosaminuronic acid transferase (WecB/TagA/CpsF family)
MVQFQRILGVRFIVGEAQQIVDLILSCGGLVVVPLGPGMSTLASDPAYRRALLGADFAITDSAFMVLIRNVLSRPKITRLSGLKYLRILLRQEEFRCCEETMWVMPRQESAERIVAWLRKEGVKVCQENIYVAPFYSGCIQDPELVEVIERRHPRHIVLALGGGVQEPLGFYLKQNISYLPTIHCIGAAIGFLAGDQVAIPVWVDRLGLGWLLRIISNPKRFAPRYIGALKLIVLMLRYRARLPDMTLIKE